MPPETASRRQGIERRRELIRVAIDVFGEAGFAGARIDEVAQRVGIRRPSVLYHFADKRALYLAAIASVVSEITERVVATEKLPTERLIAIADTWIDFVIDRPNAARLLLRQMIDSNPMPAAEAEVPVRGLLDSIQAAIDDRSSGSGPGKSLDASEFALILSSTSLVWVASRTAVEGVLGLDTLAPDSIQRHRKTLHALVGQHLSATAEATELSPSIAIPTDASETERPS